MTAPDPLEPLRGHGLFRVPCRTEIPADALVAVVEDNDGAAHHISEKAYVSILNLALSADATIASQALQISGLQAGIVHLKKRIAFLEATRTP